MRALVQVQQLAAGSAAWARGVWRWWWGHADRRLITRIAVVVVLSRLGLTVVGLIGLHAFADTLGQLPKADFFIKGAEWQNSVAGFPAVRLWFAWDASIYLNNARTLFDPLNSHNPAFFAFFPLYAIVSRLVSVILLGKIQYAMLLVSNAALVGAGYFMVKLVGLDKRDSQAGWRAFKYLLLLPGAFIFSAPQSESTFVCAAIASLYFARTGSWRWMSLWAAVAAATRSYGILLLLPLVVEIWQTHGFPWRPNWWLLGRIAAWLVLPLTALAGVLLLGQLGRGDWLAYKHLQEQHWGIHFQNPIPVIRWGLGVDSLALHDKTWLALVPLGLVLVWLRRLRLSYVLYAVMVTFIPFGMGFDPAYAGIIRYTAVVFPAAIALSLMTRWRPVDEGVTIGLAALQGLMFVLWAHHFLGYIV